MTSSPGRTPILATLLLALHPLAAPALAQDSPLVAHVDACARGRAVLGSLREGLIAPRDRTQVAVATRATVLRHGRTPSDHGSAEWTERVRVFDGGVDGALGAQLDVELGEPAGNVPQQRRRLDDSSVVELRPDGSASRFGAADALHAQILGRAAFPAALLAFLTEGQVLDATENSGGSVDVLVALDGGRALVRTAAAESHAALRLVGVDWMTHSELLGDVVESLTYTGEPAPAAGVASGWTVEGPFGTGASARVEVPEAATDIAPFHVDAARVAAEAAPPPTVELRALGAGAFELLVAAESARSVATDLGEGWAVLEAPVSSEIGEALVRALESEKPGHPFLYAAASHHHPHYIGGLRPFVARGATIVCPTDVAEYVRGVLERPRTLEPDALERTPRPLKLVGVEVGARWSPAEAPERLVAVDSKGRSAHTEAFLLFFLPEQHIAFGGDLLWLPVEEYARGPNPRTLGLRSMLTNASDIETREFLTSWPAGGAPVGGRAWRDRVPLEAIVGPR